MEIIPFEPSHRDACLAIFDSNFPAPARPTFAEFLNEPGAFFVAEHNGAIVGCGGFSIHGAQATLHWGMVHRDWQRQGLGRFLLFYRTREISKAAPVELVTLTCPPAAAGFFASQGFRETAAGPDSVQMVKRLAVCT